jgi:hypothetical protein
MGLLVSPVHAQTTQTINLRGETVSLGMARAQVLAKFQDYRLICVKDKDTPVERCDSMMMTSSSTPYKAYGSFGFKNDRLSYANKYWSGVYENGTPEQFAEAMFNILRQDIGDSQSATYIVTVRENSDPSGNMKEVTLTSGRKSVQISIGESIRDTGGTIIPTFVNLDEVIRQ